MKFRLSGIVAWAAVASLLAVLGMTTAPAALAAPAAATVTATGDSVAAVQPMATCYYRVMATDGLAVRESPGGLFLKWKYYPDVVSSPCTVRYEYGRWWRAVYCTCAADGIGWMAEEWLVRL